MGIELSAIAMGVLVLLLLHYKREHRTGKSVVRQQPPQRQMRNQEPKRSQGLVSLTEWEVGFIQRTLGSCPDCTTGCLLKGPAGTCAMNVLCDTCGAKFNLGFADGTIWFAERIGILAGIPKS